MRVLSIILLAAVSVPVFGQHAHQPHARQAGQELPALSLTQRADIEAGRGAGLALPAEVNGHPGPMHVLEHAQALGLSESQSVAVAALMPPMREAAIAAGARYLDAERRLNTLFATAVATPDTVRVAATEAALANAEMRLAHLLPHLATRALLSPAQIIQYDLLRGHRPR